MKSARKKLKAVKKTFVLACEQNCEREKRKTQLLGLMMVGAGASAGDGASADALVTSDQMCVFVNFIAFFFSLVPIFPVN